MGRVQIESKKMIKDLEKLGVTERKTFKLVYPEIKNSLEKHFIRGLLDGYGLVYISKRNVIGVHFCGSISILEGIKRYFKEFGISKKIYKSRSIYDIHYTGKNAEKILNILYSKSTIFLDRKYEIYKRYTNMQ